MIFCKGIKCIVYQHLNTCSIWKKILHWTGSVILGEISKEWDVDMNSHQHIFSDWRNLPPRPLTGLRREWCVLSALTPSLSLLSLCTSTQYSSPDWKIKKNLQQISQVKVYMFLRFQSYKLTLNLFDWCYTLYSLIGPQVQQRPTLWWKELQCAGETHNHQQLAVGPSQGCTLWSI